MLRNINFKQINPKYLTKCILNKVKNKKKVKILLIQKRKITFTSSSHINYNELYFGKITKEYVHHNVLKFK